MLSQAKQLLIDASIVVASWILSIGILIGLAYLLIFTLKTQ